MTAKLVIPAAGRGTRMQKDRPGVPVDPGQRRMADRGLKGLIPFHGHPYLSYVMTAAADAGFTRICLVVGPGRNPIREYYEALETTRVEISFAVQPEPRGSADAVLRAEPFAGGGDFVVINADNFYPAPALRAVRTAAGSALGGFRKDVLVERGNIPPERVAAYALFTTDDDGFLHEIMEKPDPATARRLAGGAAANDFVDGTGQGRTRAGGGAREAGGPAARERRGPTARAWVSMTLWRFRASIFDACRAVDPSPRGEYELGDAVVHAVREPGERFRVVPVDEPVLDLSRRDDIPSVAEALHGADVRL